MASDFGIKVSNGVNVLTAKEADIVFSSNRNMLKTLKAGLAQSASFPFGTAYVPIFFNGPLVAANYGTTCDAANFNVALQTRFYLFYQQGT